MRSFRPKRRVSVDANVLVAAVVYRSKLMPRVLNRIRERDELVVSNIILFQCTRQALKSKCPLTAEEIRSAILEICPDVVEIDIVPVEELRQRYTMRDDSDLETLYSVDLTRSDILVTGDDDFFDKMNPPRGVKVRFMRPREYLEEDDE